MYTADDEAGRLQQEQRQIAFVRGFPQVIGFGVWNAESPRLVDRTFVDTRRGLTSYGSGSHGGGSCYDPRPDSAARRALPARKRAAQARASSASPRAMPGPLPRALRRATRSSGRSIPLSGGDLDARILTLNGWLVDPDAVGSTGIDGLDVYLGTDPATASKLVTGAQLGLSRTDPASILANPDWTKPGFLINLPLDGLPTGPTVLTLAARTRDHGTWLSSLASWCRAWARSCRSLRWWRNPLLCYPRRRRYRPSAPKWQSPQPNDEVGRSFVVQVVAPARTASTSISSRTVTMAAAWSAPSAVPPGTSASHPVKITGQRAAR